MGRLHSKGKGISASTAPYRRTPPAWLQLSAAQVVQLVCEYAKKGITPSQIGAQLRDRHGVGRTKAVTGSKVLRILRANGLGPSVPEELHFLIKKATNVRKHLERARHDTDSKYRLILIEARIHRLARYYKSVRILPPTWRYSAQQAAGAAS